MEHAKKSNNEWTTIYNSMGVNMCPIPFEKFKHQKINLGCISELWMNIGNPYIKEITDGDYRIGFYYKTKNGGIETCWSNSFRIEGQ